MAVVPPETPAPLTIPARFNGPPNSGNGGYVAGRIAQFLPAAGEGHWPEVSLRAPPPLDTPLTVQRTAEGIGVFHETTKVATARMVPCDLDVPSAPDWNGALDGQSRFRCYDQHPLPTCFVCGTDRVEGDGLRIFTGPLDGAPHAMVAAPWTPHESCGDTEGFVRPEILWGALDCPGAFSVDEATQSGLKLLGRLSVRIFAPVPVGDPVIVAGWHLGSEGRKHGAGTALFDHEGRVLALGRALWIELKQG